MSETSQRRRRGGIYVRFSKDARDGTKIEDQIAMCRRTAEANDIEVVQIYNEGSGLSAFSGVARPEWERMLTDVADGKLDVLVGQSEDRFCRQVMDKENLQVVCAASGVTWHTVNEGPTDPSTADGEFFSTMRAGLARMEVRRKAERQRQRNAERRRNGASPRGGNRPFGYGVPSNGDWSHPSMKTIRRLVPGSGDGSGQFPEYESVEVIEYDIDKIHPVEAPLVTDAYRRYAADEITLSGIATMWNQGGIKTVRGNPWDLPKVEKVLRRGRNAGLVEHRPTDPKTGRYASTWGSPIPDAKGERIRGSWETIIDLDTYDAAMAKLTDDSRKLSKVMPAKHLSSSIAKCQCGTPLRVGSRNNGEAAYRCAVHDGASHKIPGVRHVSIRCEELDVIVRDAVVSALLFSPRNAIPDPEADELVRLSVELAKSKRARTRLLTLMLAEQENDGENGGLSDLSDIVAQRADYAREITTLERRRAAIIQRNAQADLLAHVQAQLSESDPLDALGSRSTGRRLSIEKAAEVKEQLLSKFESLPLGQRRTLVRAHLSVTVSNGRGPGRVNVIHKIATALNDADATS